MIQITGSGQTTYGPNIVTDGLVLYYDASNLRSFRGEPTINIATNQYMINHNPDYGSVMTFSDAPERGVDWKKVHITHRGVNFRITQMPYVLQPGLLTYACSIEMDWNNTVGYFMAGDGNCGFSVTNNTSTNPYAIFTNSSGTDWSEAFFIDNGTYNVDVDDIIYYRYYQVEEKNYVTPFVNGTRGTTVASGGGCIDLSLNDNGGDLINGITYDNLNRGSLVFDGIDDYINCGYGSSLWLSSAITICAWINPVNVTNLGNIASKNTNFGYRFRINSANELWVYVSGNYISSGYVPLDNWTYVAFTGDYTGLKSYINGILSTSNATEYAPDDASIGPLYIGCYAPSAESFDGKIASVKIYNRSLSASEMLQNYNTTKERFT